MSFSSKATDNSFDLVDYYNLGITLEEQGQIDKAILSYQAAWEIEPEFIDAYINLGNLLLKQGLIDEAILSYQTALRLNPTSADIHYNLGCLFKDRQIDNAIACYQSSLQYNHKDHLVKLNLAIAQLPVIYASKEEIKVRRKNYQNQLRSKWIWTIWLLHRKQARSRNGKSGKSLWSIWERPWFDLSMVCNNLGYVKSCLRKVRWLQTRYSVHLWLGIIQANCLFLWLVVRARNSSSLSSAGK